MSLKLTKYFILAIVLVCRFRLFMAAQLKWQNPVTGQWYSHNVPKPDFSNVFASAPQDLPMPEDTPRGRPGSAVLARQVVRRDKARPGSAAAGSGARAAKAAREAAKNAEKKGAKNLEAALYKVTGLMGSLEKAESSHRWADALSILQSMASFLGKAEQIANANLALRSLYKETLSGFSDALSSRNKFVTKAMIDEADAKDALNQLRQEYDALSVDLKQLKSDAQNSVDAKDKSLWELVSNKIKEIETVVSSAIEIAEAHGFIELRAEWMGLKALLELSLRVAQKSGQRRSRRVPVGEQRAAPAND